ncbi:glycoside hydrolase family 6 protein [Bradyrhizobium sp.]|uniref:glycoside hydrolase family 6 protein n=1 Tax=Bradyrhizobium sp. TaxID=376 RepID=UPI003C22E478
MFQYFKPVRESTRARLLRGCCKALLALPLALVGSNAFAQHVANPFVGATQYVNPDYANEVAAVIAQTSNAQLKAQMATVAGYPTAVWIDSMAAIAGGSANNGRLSLAQHIAAALKQQTGTEPVVITLVIYDLPQRDCAALASNGEISIAPNPPTQPLTGIQTYEQNYITPIFNILQPFASNPNVRFVLVIEPDSLPNMVTNTGLSFSIPNCVAANGGQSGSASLNGVYVQGIQFAVNQFHTLTNVYQYLDIGHSAWLGWPSNMTPAVTFYTGVVHATTAGLNSIDGFISDTANYTPTKEPFMTATESISGNQVLSANFYQFNPDIDEADYDASLYSSFVNAGFPASIGFLIDTSRNGWGASNRPTGPSTSTDLNTFVNATKIDQRNARGQWCNQSNAGLGTPPTASPTTSPGFFPQLEAFVWIKPPGESDGTYATSTAFISGNADENCDPAHSNALANNTLTGSLPNPPSAGKFFPAEFTMLVQNALPVVPGGAGGGGTPPPSPSFTLSAAPTTVSVTQGASGTAAVKVTPAGGFNAAVAFGTSGLPGNVTASLNPVSSATSTTVTLLAGTSATPGTSNVTITGTSGSLSATTALGLTVTAAQSGGGGTGGGSTGGGTGAGPATFTGKAGTVGPWFDEDDVVLSTSVPITNLALTITVPAVNAVFSNLYNTFTTNIVGTHTSGASIVYTFTSPPGLTINGGGTFAAQIGGNGTQHLATTDSWSLTYTAGGSTFSQSGIF